LDILGELGLAAASYASAVAARLEDDNYNVRLAAAEASGSLGDMGLIGAIARIQHSDWRVRSAALMAVQAARENAIGQQEAAAAELAKLLGKHGRHSPDLDLQGIELGAPQAKRAAAFLGDNQAGVRYTAAHALGEMGEQGAQEATIFLCDEDGEVQAAASEALGTMLGTAGSDHAGDVASLLDPITGKGYKTTVEFPPGQIASQDIPIGPSYDELQKQLAEFASPKPKELSAAPMTSALISSHSEVTAPAGPRSSWSRPQRSVLSDAKLKDL